MTKTSICLFTHFSFTIASAQIWLYLSSDRFLEQSGVSTILVWPPFKTTAALVKDTITSLLNDEVMHVYNTQKYLYVEGKMAKKLNAIVAPPYIWHQSK
jgi:hypothetical protein